MHISYLMDGDGEQLQKAIRVHNTVFQQVPHYHEAQN